MKHHLGFLIPGEWMKPKSASPLGKWCYLYRAVTKYGAILDFYMSTQRNPSAVIRFLGKALRSAVHHGIDGRPRVIYTYKAHTYTAAITELIDKKKLSQTVEHPQIQYLNKVI